MEHTSPLSDPTGRDHVALDVSEGRELESLPAGDGGNSHSTHNKASFWDDERQTSEKVKATESLAEIQIRGLLWLEEPGNELYLKAHNTWEAQDTLFASRIDKKKKQSSSLRNEIYQLFGFYSVFQGVLLTAVAQSSYLHCHNWWTAFFLSLLASVVSIGGIIQKFRAIVALEKTIKNEADTRQECINRVARLIRKRRDFVFAVDARDGTPRGFDLTRLRVSVIIVFVCLIAFSGLFLASIYRILCDEGDPSEATTS
ncbi:hypothetical protein M758_8G068400 [Ceratodon purpureus]|nr:hypothetical protein M758_8G068400 [Ceratodon purpureus]